MACRVPKTKSLGVESLVIVVARLVVRLVVVGATKSLVVTMTMVDLQENWIW